MHLARYVENCHYRCIIRNSLLCNILVLILALVVFNLGAGAGVVHICSAYCKTQTCSSVTHSYTDMSGCCHHSNDDSSCTSVSEECTCINVHYNIDYFFKVSHEDDVVSFIQMPFDLPEPGFCRTFILAGS